MQHHAADQLHVEMAHVQHPLACLAHHGKGFGQQRIEGFPLRHARPELVGLGTQRLVGQRADSRLQRIDLADNRRILLDQPIIAAAKNFFEKAGNHYGNRWYA